MEVDKYGQRWTKGGVGVPPTGFILIFVVMLAFCAMVAVWGLKNDPPPPPEYGRKTISGVECIMHDSTPVSCNWGSK